MSSVLNINGQTAVRTQAKVKWVHNKSSLVKFTEDLKEVWFPNSTVRDNKDGTVDIQEWIYDIKMKELEND